MNLDLDLTTLAPQDRAAFDRLARVQIAQLEEEQRLAAEQMAVWAKEDAAKSVEAWRAENRDAALTVADAAARRARGAEKNIAVHLQRSKTPGISAEMKTAEERLAIEAFRRTADWAEIEKRFSSTAAAYTVSEPDLYSRTSPNSWFGDVAALSRPGTRDHRDAADRLERYGKALARDFSPAGIRARNLWREATRKDAELRSASEAEFRAMTTGSASGGAMVPPVYLVEDLALYRTYPATFWNLACTSKPIPAYGMTVDVPVISGPADAGVATENVAQNEVDPTAGYSTQPVQTYTSLVNASQQLFDRAGPVGFDQILYMQLSQQLESQLDAQVIALALAGATVITRTSGSLTLAQWQADVAKAATALRTTQGTALQPTNVTGASGIGEWLLAQTTSSGTGWFQASLGARRSQNGDTGQSVSGIGFALDDNIPAAGSNAQILVSNPEAVYVYSGEPIVAVSPGGSLAGGLESTFTMRRYGVPIVRYAKGVSVITGSGYPAAPTYV